jgi:HAD superfamily hydrolase (TIGR01509 family)
MARNRNRTESARLWMFDFDGTLARLEPEVDWAASRRELEPYMRSAGAPTGLFEQFPRGNLMLYNAWLMHLEAAPRRNGRPHAASQATLRRASAIIEKYELRGAVRAAPLPGAAQLLRTLDATGATVAIVTSNSSRTVRRWLNRTRLAARVRFIVGRDSLFPLKPSPVMLRCALARADALPEAASFVGDSEADVDAARAAGVRFYAVARSAAARDRLLAAGASRIFASPAALAIYLNLSVGAAPSSTSGDRRARGAR